MKLTNLSRVLLSNITAQTDTDLSFINISRESEYWDYRISFPALSAGRKYQVNFDTDPLPLAGGFKYTVTVKANIFGTGTLTPMLFLDDDSVVSLSPIQYKSADHLDYYAFETSPDKNLSVIGFGFKLDGWTSAAGNGFIRYYEIKGLNSSDQVGDAIDKQTEQQKGFFEKLGDRIGGFFTDLFNKIMDGLKSLFIPSDGFLETWVTDMQEWLKARFGALYFPIDLTTRFFNAFMSIKSSEDISLTFPALQVGEVTLLEEQHYSMSEATGFLGDIYNVYLYVADAIVIVGLVLLLGKKLESILTK